MFQYLIGDMDKNKQATLAMMYHNSCNIDEMNHRHEMERMKKEITEAVISRISATVDVSEIIDQIEELRRIIDSLGR